MVSPSGEHQILLGVIYNVLKTQGRWPPYAYVDHVLDTEHDLDINKVRQTLPLSLTDLPPAPYGLSDQQEVKLTIEGLRLCGAADDVTLFFQIFRHMVDVQKKIVATIDAIPKPCLTTDGLSMEWSVHPSDLTRVFRVIALEPWSASWTPIGEGNTNVRICADPGTLRRFREAETLDKYLEIRRAFYEPSRPAPVTAPDVLRSLDRVGRAAEAADATAFTEASIPTPRAWDVFIVHASANKEAVVRPLAAALKAAGLEVWVDEFELTVGDHLRRKIDEGLRRSNYGVVILSPDFFESDWSQAELDGLAQLEVNHRKVILPILHRLKIADVRDRSPMLADRLAVDWSRGVDYVVKQLLRAMNKQSGRKNV